MLEITEEKYLNFIKWRNFHAGLWMLMIATSVLVLIKTRWHINSVYVSAPFLCFGMLFLLNASFRNWADFIKQTGGFYRVTFTCLLAWGLFVGARNFVSMDPTVIRDMWGIRLTSWAWFVPAVMLLSINTCVIRQLLNVMMRQGALGLILLAIVWLPPLSLRTDFNLLWGCSALLLFWDHLPKWGRRTALAGAFLSLAFVVLSAERNMVLAHLLLMLCASYILIMRKYHVRGRRLLGILALYSLALILAYFVSYGDNRFLFGETIGTQITAFEKKLFKDTRTGSIVFGEGDAVVEGDVPRANLFLDFLEDMGKWEMIFGRGSVGTYRSMASGGISRANVECGYLQVILKGGVVMLVLMLLLAIPAMIRGIFTSRNYVAKAFGFIVAGRLIEMVFFGLPEASPRYALFWIAIGICLNSQILRMTDSQIEVYMDDQGDDDSNRGEMMSINPSGISQKGI
ncbi:MAG: hypothetical protein A4E69_02522 [Syntrophus sp. PtaB.Bin138]|nr:MAG: hypothetical protein A4E69_02522 [Syntrophus sp. PtaB.Bin138]